MSVPSLSADALLDVIEGLMVSQKELVLTGNADALRGNSRELANRLRELSALPARSDLMLLRERIQSMQKAAYATGTLLGQRHAAVQSAIQAMNVDQVITRKAWNGIYASAGFLRSSADPRSFGLA